MKFKQFLDEMEMDDLINESYYFLEEAYEKLQESDFDIVLEYIIGNNDFSTLELTEEELLEKLSILTRKKRSNMMRRMTSKLQRGKEIMATHNVISQDEVEKRARIAAVNALKTLWSKGRDDIKTKEKIEDKLAKSGKLITRIANKMKKNILAKEREKNDTSGINEEDLLSLIYNELNQMDADEIDEFGYTLYDEFFDKESDEDDEDEFDIDDVKDMIKELGSDFHEEILDLLDVEEYDELDEGVTRIMKKANYNRKKRKFMATSKSKLRQQKAKRKRDARLNKTKRKRYYKANKMKIAAYQKSRREAIKKGQHKVKKRRTTG